MTPKLGHAPVHPVQGQLDPGHLDRAVVRHGVQPCDDTSDDVMMTVMSLTHSDLGEGQKDGDHDEGRDDRSQYQQILTGMGAMPPSSHPSSHLLGLGSQCPASERHQPAGAGGPAEPEPRGRASVLVITDHDDHCFVDTMHTEIVNNGLNESEKSCLYFD